MSNVSYSGGLQQPYTFAFGFFVTQESMHILSVGTTMTRAFLKGGAPRKAQAMKQMTKETVTEIVKEGVMGRRLRRRLWREMPVMQMLGGLTPWPRSWERKPPRAEPASL